MTATTNFGGTVTTRSRPFHNQTNPALRHQTNLALGLMATRFLLGSFEACVAPTFIAIVQMWYRRGEQTVRNAAWYAQLGVVNIVSL
jgi:hypothetical protein